MAPGWTHILLERPWPHGNPLKPFSFMKAYLNTRPLPLCSSGQGNQPECLARVSMKEVLFEHGKQMYIISNICDTIPYPQWGGGGSPHTRLWANQNPCKISALPTLQV